MSSKFEVASVSDAVVHPFYWQLFNLLEHIPASVVDCGAHCGHFTVLADICIRLRFGASASQYTLIEPNPLLGPMITRTLAAAKIAAPIQVVQGILGCDEEFANLWVKPNNYLASGLSFAPGATAYRVPCVRAVDVIPAGPVDVLKIDIEGGEYDLLKNEPDLFNRSGLLFLEVHQAPAKQQDWFFDRLDSMGFHEVGPRVEHCGQLLVAMSKTVPAFSRHQANFRTSQGTDRFSERASVSS